MTERTVSCVLPLPPDELWVVLIDTPRMIAIDPALESYEPEGGVLRAGNLNRATSRLGPLRLRMVTRTEVLDPPRRAVFSSVEPARPVRVTAEDTLTPVQGGTRYTVRVVVEPAGLGGRLVAPLLARVLARSRRKLFGHLRDELDADRS